jgi:hypothetical protein
MLDILVPTILFCVLLVLLIALALGLPRPRGPRDRRRK